MFYEPKTCRACGSKDLSLILDLGKMALANDFMFADEMKNYDRVLPLRLRLCKKCSLVQLAEVVDPKILYSRYAYVTSDSMTMAEHLKKLCEDLMDVGNFKKPLRVLEFGSNTGRFLKVFQAKKCEVLGVEPAENIGVLARQDGVPTRTDFFDKKSAAEIAASWGKADIITGRHVFAHIDDWHAMVNAFHALISDDGIVAIEVPYLVDFYNGVQFDTVYHEHLSYVSVKSIIALLEKTPLQLERVLRYPIHGGSIVLILKKRNVSVHPCVKKALDEEKSLGLDTLEAWKKFEEKVNHIRETLPALVQSLRKQNKRIVAYGASAKGNTLLNTCRLTKDDLDYIVDNTPFKQGKLAPGSWIPIHPPDYFSKDRPDFALILAWNFADEIMQREKNLQQHGGRFIVPIPNPRIIASEN